MTHSKQDQTLTTRYHTISSLMGPQMSFFLLRMTLMTVVNDTVIQKSSDILYKLLLRSLM